MKNMAFIQKIYNDINNKLYIGKTEYSIDKRFKEHCREALKNKNKNRPLYSAMRKYGQEHFFIQKIEETDNSEEREKYWIAFYNTYHKGYNATKGGDGKPYIDEQKINKLWQTGSNIKEIHEQTQYDLKTIRRILRKRNHFEEEKRYKKHQKCSKKINMIDINTNIVIQQFDSSCQAEKFLNIKNSRRHIVEVCKHKRLTAYGYKWSYAED